MDWPNLNQASPQNPNRRALSPGVEIKRSSWSAGMATNIPPPPGSPAAWQEMRKNHPRSASPSKYLNVPLQPIRAVSGNALTEKLEVSGMPHLGPPDSGHDIPHNDHAHSHSHYDSPHDSPQRGRNSYRSTHQHDHQHDNDQKGGNFLESPFQFTPTFIEKTRPRANHRKGHHYKHSSVSMSFFQEPEERAPLAIPVSLAVPTLKEYYQSITHPQFMRLLWCCIRMLVAVTVYIVNSEVHAVAPLAHLLAYETVVSMTAALVNILANFDVWNKSSLRLPFALKRAEALVAFGLAAVLLFIGGDVISHLVQHLVQGHGHNHHSEEHGNDHDHDHESSPWAHQLIVLISIITTIPSAVRQRKSNPLALTTLFFAVAVLMIPSVPAPFDSLMDYTLTPVIALTMIYVGWNAAKLFGGMLVMSYGGKDPNLEIAQQICKEPGVAEVDDICLWQVHHDLWMASMRVHVTSSSINEVRIREVAEKAVETAVGVVANWQMTIEIVY